MTYIIIGKKKKHIFQPQPSPLFKRCTSIGGGKKAFVDGGYSSVSFLQKANCKQKASTTVIFT